MRLSRRVFSVSILLASILSGVVSAQADLLKPFKDDLFAYPGILETKDGGAHVIVDYDSKRDINARDAEPERRANPRYVDLAPRKMQRDLALATPVGKIPHMAVGEPQGARFIVIYLHGQGGSRQQGMNDFTFGGNFNRIKNLAARNKGLYLTADFSDFGKAGASQVAAVISAYLEKSPAAKVYVACGSMGGGICWQIANSDRLVPKLGGLLLLGSHWDNKFTSSAAYRTRVPVFLGHGSADKVFPVEKQEQFFQSIRKLAPNYPIRFARFETGSHGTPIRMVDWRLTLNWMASVR